MLKSLGFSLKGSKSSENEDSWCVNAANSVYVVADGVGGGPAGKLASKTLIEEFIGLTGDRLTRSTISGAIEQANKKILALAADPAKKGMATTVVVIWIEGSKATVFNVGDSRAYSIENDDILQLTVDHSKLMGNDQKSKTQITNAVGAKEKFNIEISEFEMIRKGFYLLMSDGVSDALSDVLIHDIVSRSDLSLFEKCVALTNEAENKGGRDDKTVILVSIAD